MDRLAEILKFASKTAKGVEIAPWFAPIAAKSAGYNVTILDVFPTEELRRRAAADPNIPKDSINRIETVDFVGSAVEIATIVGATDQLGTFDYIISSHNFEHLPNPIKFLQGCQKVLKPGGVLSMAIPDHRACFDHFRPHTTIADWLEAYFENRQRPKLSQIFAQTSYACELKNPPGRETAFFVDDNAAEMRPNEVLRESYNDWLAARDSNDSIYRDAHCSVLTISSIQLLVAEAKFLGLIDFDVKAVAGLNGCEFFIHLQNGPARPDSDTDFYAKRSRLFQQVADEIAKSSAWGWSVQHGRPAAMVSLAAQPTQEELRDAVLRLSQSVQSMQASPVWRVAAAASRNRLLKACFHLFFKTPAAP
jgi:SAM-dependent methyltransferase